MGESQKNGNGQILGEMWDWMLYLYFGLQKLLLGFLSHFILYMWKYLHIAQYIFSIFLGFITRQVSGVNSSNIFMLLRVVGAAQSGVRRNLEMRRAAGAVRRQRCFMSWPASCLSHTASAHIWIKPPSWDWPSATCGHANSSPQVHTHSSTCELDWTLKNTHMKIY